jgi:magnesium transporter
MLSFLPIDHQAAILAHLSPEDRRDVEHAFGAESREGVDRLLRFPASAVGRLMNPKIWTVDRDKTAGDALASLRALRREIEVAPNCYVVEGRRLVGVAPLRELAVAPPETPIAEIMTRDPIAVGEDTDRSDAAEIIQTHDFLSLPVIDRDGNLVGAVRVDDLLDAALDKVGAGLLNQGGVAGKVAATLPYFQTRLLKVVRSRITWLILLFVAETATGTVLRYFEDELAKVVALSFFVPLLIGTGGNAGSQTVSTVIRALALGEVRVGDLWRVVVKEVSAGILLGVLLGTIAFGRALLWGVGVDLAACVALTIFVVCTWANAVGATVPLAAQKLKIDPTVISAPLITTLVDASGLFIYFSVAHLLVRQLAG